MKVRGPGTDLVRGPFLGHRRVPKRYPRKGLGDGNKAISRSRGQTDGGTVSDETTATGALSAQNEWVPSSTYRHLGLIGNPFALRELGAEPFIELETRAQTHRLLMAIDEQADATRPKVIWVEKAELPPSYALQAVAEVEHAIVQDQSLNLVHAYIQLAMMRMGRVRAVLQMVSERVAFGRLDKTISAWTERVLAEPDPTFESYGELGVERLTAFRERIRS